jgi:hypothetical protein
VWAAVKGEPKARFLRQRHILLVLVLPPIIAIATLAYRFCELRWHARTIAWWAGALAPAAGSLRMAGSSDECRY